jgi:hypothetical protein
VQQCLLIALATVLGTVAFEAWADRGAFRGHSRHHQLLRLPSAIVRLPAYSPRWSQPGPSVTRPHAPRRHPQKFFRHPRPPHTHYAPVYAAPLVVYPSSDAPDTQGYAYFCPDSRRYYPDVDECPSAWLAVVPDAPGLPGASHR